VNDILVVDDSAVFRSAITMALQQSEGFKVIYSAHNGKRAVELLKEHPTIKAITLDLEMPVMDGMQTITEIRKFNQDVIIIVFSSQTVSSIERTLNSLNSGANDFIEKNFQMTSVEACVEEIKNVLVPKVQALINSPAAKRSMNVNTDKILASSNPIDDVSFRPDLVLIGSSTGGPETLTNIFHDLDDSYSLPTMIVQHMPPVFTEKFAGLLDKHTPQLTVKESAVGDKIEEGKCYVAKGDHHVVLKKEGEDYLLDLNQDEKVCFVRPSVDVTLFSIAKNFDGRVLAIILTGMGADGADGIVAIKDKTKNLYYQDKDSCVVWGMPAAVFQAGVGAKEIKLSQIAEFLSNLSKMGQ
jgi:two-component system, chemotaxis family, protein-glutamate methylesterase/glutaminase